MQLPAGQEDWAAVTMSGNQRPSCSPDSAECGCRRRQSPPRTW